MRTKVLVAGLLLAAGQYADVALATQTCEYWLWDTEPPFVDLVATEDEEWGYRPENINKWHCRVCIPLRQGSRPDLESTLRDVQEAAAILVGEPPCREPPRLPLP